MTVTKTRFKKSNNDYTLAYPNWRKSKIMKKILKETGGEKNTVSIEKQRLELHLTSWKPCKQEENGVRYLKC